MVRYTAGGVGEPTTLAELAVQQRNLRVTCSCGHSVVIDGIALWWAFQRKGHSDHLAEVGRHLFCAACLARTGHKVRSPRVELTSDEGRMLGLPCPGRETWKRLVARFRR